MINTLKPLCHVSPDKEGTVRLRAISIKSRLLSTTRIYRNPIVWLALMPILAVTPSFADTLPDFSQLVEEQADTVVKISVLTVEEQSVSSGFPGINPDQIPEQFRRFFEQMPQNPDPEPRQGAGFGSGFIISDDGYIITNAHVVDKATEIKVGLNDRREYTAKLIGSDTASDIALLKLDAGTLPSVTIGDSDTLKVGEWVLAIGSPFGFEHTATQGIVSALARSLPDDTYVPFIQTDVAVNPGNSGGPLFNTDGEVVGVNSQIYSRSGGYQGLSFSIPINVAMSIANQLKESGFATRGWLGVGIQNVDQSLAESFGLDKPEGALVSQVTAESPADKAGLVSGDIILQFNGRAVAYSSALPPLVGAVVPGETVSMEVLRNGKMKTLDVTIEPLDEGRQVSAVATPDAIDESRLGVEVAKVPAKQAEEMGISSGVVVAKIDPDGVAAKAGIREGDVILSLNRESVDSVSKLEELTKEAPAGEAIPILVQRERSPMFLALTLPSS
ncbi:DegQ family serine endoprotease [Granulosicoccus antarcticus]|uniref:Probable periplasmic serine endoprotease DegP-like n=1 Tax=Granulosicoccus antarcticus IMCC3135 TaxID=1192854 RepID=A0A2Z2NGR9_9GAMM|nr:DegQ family serine endoprotease [Granulosicoccus antarcticus]ASJ70472.1 Periplasmic pH-dependent serine endoprotease DegQ [Granulosicoccus antarcticus IMCC3135]